MAGGVADGTRVGGAERSTSDVALHAEVLCMGVLHGVLWVDEVCVVQAEGLWAGNVTARNGSPACS